MIAGRLSDEREMLRATVREFAINEIAPVSAHHDRLATFPYKIVKKMGEMGLFGIPFAEEYGGMGGDYFELCLVIEELARVDQSVAITLEAACSLGAMPIYRFGSDEQKQRWLPELCSGKALAAFGLTEEGAGSDAQGTRTTARLDGDHWMINGSKAFITNSGTEMTRLVILTAVTSTSDSKTKEISTFIVGCPTFGLSVGPPYDKVGWHASDTHPLSFHNVRIPQSNLLGEVGRGFANILSILDEGRIAISALAVGAAQGCVDESINYAKEREAFGRPICRNQAISFKIAEMEARTHVARCAYYDAADRMLNGHPFKKEASIAKLVSSNAAMENARDATQIHGGYGFLNESLVGRHFRDSKILEIGEGTSEMQKILIARSLGL